MPCLDILPDHFLKPRPICLYQNPRRYINLETGHAYGTSITRAIGAVTLTDGDREHIERHRPSWEPRGTLTHLALEQFLKTGQLPDGDDLLQTVDPFPETLGDYRDWWQPLCEHSIWDTVTVIASELIVADDAEDWAGTLDLAVRWPDGTYGVLDAKSKGSKSSKKQDVKPQLGAATQALNDTYGLHCTRNAVLWAYPGQTRLEPFDADECLGAWRDLWDYYCATHRAF